MRENLYAALRKSASAAGSPLLAEAEKNPSSTKLSSPAEGIGDNVDGVVTDHVGVEGQPGTASEITGNATVEGEGGVDVTQISGNADGEAAEVLGVVNKDVTEENVENMNKAANALRVIGQQIADIQMADFEAAMNKQASELDFEGMLVKHASAGDPRAQFVTDLLSAYQYGMAKKASDIEEMGATTPEEAELADAALTEAAEENPEALMADLSGEEVDPELIAAAQEEAAAVENEVQEAILDVAEQILDTDPSVSEEEAVAAAQDAVVDALQMVDAQQAIGAVDEDGEYAIDDETAANAVDNMTKTASDYPLRDVLVGRFNATFGLSPESFAYRLGF
jgi:hypothetical protein